MILVDTSVLISFLKNQTNTQVLWFEAILDAGLPWGINAFIYQELLQGAKNEREFTQLKTYFETIPFYGLNFGNTSVENTAKLNLLCRQAGVTVRSSIDLLIAQTAIENDLLLLHNDGDFERMARVIPELNLYQPHV